MSLLALFIFSLIWYLNVSCSWRCIPKCFWDDICWTVELLNKRGGCYSLFIFREKISSWACLDGSGLKYIFHSLALRLTLSRSLFSFCEVLIGSQTTKNIEVSSAKSFTLDSRLSDKSLIYIKKKTMDQELDPEEHQLSLSTIQSLPIQNNSFLSFELKKIQSKLQKKFKNSKKDHPLHPCILSYK